MKKTITAGLLGLILSMFVQPAVQAASNTLVRFHFSHGSTAVGDMVVELFDEEKPLTVQNFLTYVRNGSYDNLILYRCIPNFVIQAGIVRSPDPLNLAAFSGSLINQSRAPVTNEFGVGPYLTNGYGTLAMAKNEGDPNSAKVDWFFNLTNNSATLDTNNGGFTVFGRVISGTNVLNFFNHPSASLGFYHFSSPFEDMPVAYNRNPQPYPRFRDLFNVQVTIIDGPEDSKRPTIKIDFPPPNLRWSNDTITVQGTATDNAGIQTIWQIGEGGFDVTNAVGTTNWSLDYPLLPGTNSIFMQSVDTKGHRSPVAARTLFWSIPQTIQVNWFGPGRVTGPTNGQVLELERFYYLNAIPDPGYAFHSWTGHYAGEAFTIHASLFGFPMKTNLSATALFVPNPFPALKGAYVGSFFNVSNFLNLPQLSDTLGTITFNLTDRGKYTGRVRQGKGSYPFSGGFTTRGFTTNLAIRPGLAPLEIRMTLDVSNNTGEAQLLLSDNQTWGSYGRVLRAATGTLAHPSSYAGQYTLALPGGSNSVDTPPGTGPGTAKIGSNGALNFAGTLPDGTPVAQGSPISTNGLWPLYLSLYAGKGALFSWAQFDTNLPNDDVRGPYVWIKRTNVASAYYRAGFVITNSLTGSLYRVPPGTTNRLLQLTNASFAFTDGNLATPLTNDVLLFPNNTVTNLGPNPLKATFTKANGLFTGSITPPAASKPVPFKGAVYQKRNNGEGYFLGTNQAGAVFFGP